MNAEDLLIDDSNSPVWPRADVITVGETLLRLSPPGYERLGQCKSLGVHVAGSESNVASGLAALGHTVRWCSRLPDQPLGRSVAALLAGAGILIDAIHWTESNQRLGLFFYEPGVPPRPPIVVYDRGGSAASTMRQGDFGSSLLAAHKHLHLSGITASLSPSCAEMCRMIAVKARDIGLTVSFDINYRAKLWAPKVAADTLREIAQNADILICSAADAALLYSLTGTGQEMSTHLRAIFQCKMAIVTGGDTGSFGWDGNVNVSVPPFIVERTVERLGSGDAFASGVISSFLSGGTLHEHLLMGSAAAALKRTVTGDLTAATRAEIVSLLNAETTSQRWR